MGWPELRLREAMNRCRLTIYYSGRVQGVGFRYTTKSVAAGYEVVGTVRNLADGRVELVIEGDRSELELFRGAVQDSGLGGLIRGEEVVWGPATGEFRGFGIG
jgi:acylphosphatase